MLSDYYAMEVCAIDVQTLNPYIYGEGKKYKERAYLIYNGIHYDVIVGTKNGKSQVRFESTDHDALAKAVGIAKKAHEKKKFVNTATFSIRCEMCGAGLVGTKEAQAHAEATGHVKFSQY